MIKSLIAEYCKLKNTNTWIMIICGAVFAPVFTFLIYFFRTRYFIPVAGENIWVKFLDMNISFTAGVFLPFLIVLLVSNNLNIENKADSWKRLYQLPVKKETLYWSKLFFLMLQLVVVFVIFLVVFYFFGMVLGLTKSELPFLEHKPDILSAISSFSGIFISMLGIFILQFVLSIHFNNSIVPISVGTFCIVVSLILASKWKYSYIDPYALTYLYTDVYRHKINLPFYLGLSVVHISSILYFLIAGFAGMFYFKSKKIK